MSDRIHTAMAGGMHPSKAAPGLARKPRWLAAALAACVLSLCFWACPARAEITFLNAWGSLGPGHGQFDQPSGLAVGPGGEVYVADSYNDRIQKFNSSGVFLIDWGIQGSGDGQFYAPQGVAVSAAGQVYVADTGNHRIQRFDSRGGFLGRWGRGPASGDGQFYWPRGVAVSPAGEVYVADTSNDRIQKFNAFGGFLTKWGSQGSGDGQFRYPYDAAVSAAGEVYVADSGNDRIQVFDSSGGFLTKWGSEGSGDGQFNYPFGVAVSPAGEVYVADTYNNRIQKFDSSGGFLTKWGLPGSGDGQFDVPHGIAVSPTGYVYVSDTGNNRIQRFFDSDAWVSGTHHFDNAGVGTGELLGASLALDPARGLVVANTTTVEADGTLTVEGGTFRTNHLTVRGAYTFISGSHDVSGTLTLDGGVVTVPLLPGGASVQFDAGTLNITGAGGVTVGSGYPLGQVLTINSARTLGVSYILAVAPDATLTVSSAGTVNVGDTLRAWPLGTVELLGGQINTGSLLVEPAGAFSHTGGTLTVDGGTFDPGISDYAIQGSGNPTVILTNGATCTLGGPSIGGTVPGTLRIESGADLATNQAYIGSQSGSQGFVTVDGAGSSWTNSNALTVGHAGTGTLDITGGAAVTNAAAYIAYQSGSSGTVTVDGAGSTWTNSGSLYVGGYEPAAGGTGTLIVSGDAQVNVGGTLKVWPAGTVDLNGGTLAAGTIDHTAGGAFDFTGGRLHAGTFLGNLLNLGGTLAPGGSAGTTTVQGHYVQAAGTLEIELGGTAPGTGHDVLEVTGAASLLGGTLAVSLIDSFEPAAGDAFTVLTYGSRAGEFATITGWDHDDLAHLAIYGAEALTLHCTYFGDATLDGCVDGLDYVVWSNNYKQHNQQWQDGDFTGEGYVDGLDYVIWSNNYHQGRPGVPGAVPEPSSALVLVLGICALRRRRRRA